MRDKYFTYTETIYYATAYLDRVIKETLKQIDKEVKGEISSEEYIILETVYLNPGLIQSEIANKIFIQSSYISKLLTSLEKSNYIRREQSIRGSRQVVFKIFITDDGKKVFKKIRGLIIKLMYNNETEDNSKRYKEIAQTLKSLADEIKEKNNIKF